ncbi:hypothetical protein [Mycolicibacterium cosmeticum]|uniref:hypothetical protein n=1 Tax=Mycolicibacterium cosmeticum TaxID=258533 RepID=UPI003204AA8A
MSELIHTDGHGRVTLAGHPNSTYVMREEPDGVLVLEPATDMSVAQATYLVLPTADRAHIDEFLDNPSTAVKRTYRRRQ